MRFKVFCRSSIHFRPLAASFSLLVLWCESALVDSCYPIFLDCRSVKNSPPRWICCDLQVAAASSLAVVGGQHQFLFKACVQFCSLQFKLMRRHGDLSCGERFAKVFFGHYWKQSRQLRREHEQTPRRSRNMIVFAGFPFLFPHFCFEHLRAYSVLVLLWTCEASPFGTRCFRGFGWQRAQ